MSGMLRELRYILRTLARNPGFTAVAVITLALGVGANLAVFTLVNSVLLRPLPYRDSNRLVLLTTVNAKTGELLSVSRATYTTWKEHCKGLEDLAAFTIFRGPFEGLGQSGYAMEVAASSNFFQFLGVQPQIGRTFLPGEDLAANSHPVVLSYGLWQRAFGGDRNIVGKPLTLNGLGYSVAGVMPPTFKSPPYDRVDAWIPLTPDLPAASAPNLEYMAVLGRMKRGAVSEAARVEMETLIRATGAEGPERSAELRVEMTSLREVLVVGIRRPILILFGSVSFLLLIACANLVNMQLARLTARSKEVAVRTALGASRFQVMRQPLSECLLLGLGSYVLAVPVAYWAANVLTAALAQYISRLGEVRLDGYALAFGLAASILTGLISGVAPAFRASGMRASGALAESLKEGGVGIASGFGRNWFGRLVVVWEIALSLILCVGAGLMLRTFLNLRPADMGFDPENKLAASARLPRTKYAAEADRIAFFSEIRERLRAVPAIRDVAAALPAPMWGDSPKHVTILGWPTAPREGFLVSLRLVSDNYFKLMRVRLVRGRFFAPFDDSRAAPVAIINEAMAQRLGPGEDFMGKHLIVPEIEDKRTWQVVGVVANERILLRDTKPRPQVYIPFLQHPMPIFQMVVETVGDPAKLVGVVRGQVSSVDKGIDVAGIQTLEQMISDSVLFPRRYAALAAVSAVLALVLAAAGVYGVISYSVAQRTHEMGIRMALGAKKMNVLRLVVGEAAGVAAVGVGIGVIAALGLMRSLSTLLFGVKPSDVGTFAGASLVLFSAALLASYIPARRATRVDPLVALRHE